MSRRVELRGRLRMALGGVLLVAVAGWPCPAGAATRRASAIGFSGTRAFEHVRRIVSFGARPSGSAALARTQQYIVSELRALRLEVEEDAFIAHTPLGEVPMKNLIARIPGARADVIVLATHYESKRMPDFLGANDGGSSTGLMLELARVLAAQKNACTIWIVFFDGEEPLRDWSETDGLYGSRHLVAQWKASGALARIRAFILADLVGDRELGIFREESSTPWLLDLASEAVARLGYRRYFFRQSAAVIDDHTPWLRAGVPAIDLIDFEYGSDNRYWHTSEDTLDKLSPRSLEIVGRLILEMVRLYSKKMGLRGVSIPLGPPGPLHMRPPKLDERWHRDPEVPPARHLENLPPTPEEINERRKPGHVDGGELEPADERV